MMEEEDMVMISRWNIRDEEDVVTAKNFKYINHWHDLQRGEEGGGKKQDPWNPLHHPCLSYRQQQVGDDHQYQHHHRFNDLNNPGSVSHLQCQDKSIIVMFPIRSWSQYMIDFLCLFVQIPHFCQLSLSQVWRKSDLLCRCIIRGGEIDLFIISPGKTNVLKDFLSV